RLLFAQGTVNSENCSLSFDKTERLIYVHVEDLRVPIVDGLLALLKDRHAGVLFATSTVLGFLASERSVRDRVLTEETFWNLSHEYYDVLSLEYDEKGRGPRTGASLALLHFALCWGFGGVKF
ncbi:hypothetical protein L210DRAFT_3481450, partial [Boletus edulis BED1]